MSENTGNTKSENSQKARTEPEQEIISSAK